MAYAAPTISVKFNGNDLPSNGYLTVNTPTIDVSITPDSGIALDPTTFIFMIDGTNTGATLNGTTSSFTPSALSEGSHEVIITIADTTQQTGVPASTPFKVDTTKPVLTAAVTPLPAGTWIVTGTQQLTASCTDTNPCTVEYKVPSQNGGNYQTFSSAVDFTNNNETVSVRAKDAAGNTTDATDFELKIDTTVPTGPSVDAPSSSTYINDKTPTITLTSTDALSGLSKAFIKCDGGSFVEKTMTSSPLAISDFDITSNSCPSGDGSRTLKVKIQDVAGNATSEQSFTIKYDGHDPESPNGLDDVSVSSSEVKLEWDEADDASGGSGIDEYIVYRHTSNSFSDADEIDTTDGTTLTDDDVDACTDYYYWVVAKDDAGNKSEESDELHIKTTGCSSSSSGSSSSSSGSGSGSSGSSGGSTGSGTACSVTFDIPTNVYSGEKMTPKVSGSAYANGYFRVTPEGGTSITIQQVAASSTSWSGPFTVPTKIGQKLTFRFGADGGCLSSTTRTIKDPATKTTVTTTAPPATNNENVIPVLKEETDEPKVDPVSKDVILLLEAVPTFMSDAGFNAENTTMRDAVLKLLNDWKAIKTVSVVPIGDEGKYAVRITIKLENTTKNGTIKIVEQVPKSLAATASELETNYKMTVLKDDPLIQFEIPELMEGQTIELTITGKQTYSIEEANEKATAVAGDATTPPLLFASGVARPNPNGGGDALAGITGLIGGVGSTAPLVIGFLAIVGLIMVSVRVIRGSVAGADNPILRSAAGAQRGGNRTLGTTNGKKIWKSARKGDAY